MAGDVKISFRDKLRGRVGAIVLYRAEDGEFSRAALKVWERTGLDFNRIADASGFSGRQGHMVDILAPRGLDCDRLVVLGRGKDDSGGTPAAWMDRGGSLIAKLTSIGVTDAAVFLDDPSLTPALAAELAAGARLRHYTFDKYRTRNGPGNGEVHPINLVLRVDDISGFDAALADRMAVVEGTLMARTLVNEPANVLGPVEFAAIANRLSDFGVDVEVLTPEDMAERGMGALLAVAQGSERPARLVVMQWRGGAKSDAPLAFVGKGVVFDSGGISIKPSANMGDMKGDMGGAAAIAGLMKALALRKAKVNAVGVIGLVENMPDGRAYRPGDIITAMSGTTIEIISTDAEGRMVLADALWYTQERFKPQFMIDLATLTGAVVVALGHDHAALFTNSGQLAERLEAAGVASGEKVWHMPLGPAYEKLIESRFADIKNSGGRPAGSITAAQFLACFVADTPWAHLDIAGTAFGVPSSEINTSWGTGFGVALLDRFIRDYYEN